jgi:PAS domain S-box-containing protein
MQLQKVIEQLGYSSNAAKVYLAALALGEAHVSDIAVKTNLPRTTVQTLVDKLHEDGLMNFYVTRRYKYWVAESPERLLAHLKKRESAVQDALPELMAIKASSRGKRAKRGKNGIGLFRAMADAVVQPVLVANEDKEIMYVNAAWEKLLGYTLDEVRGKNPRILQSGETPRRVYEKMWEELGKGHLFQSDEIVDKCKDRSIVHLLTTIFPVEHGGKNFYIQILDEHGQHRRVEKIQKQFSGGR